MKTLEQNVPHSDVQIHGCTRLYTNKNNAFFISTPRATIMTDAEEPLVRAKSE